MKFFSFFLFVGGFLTLPVCSLSQNSKSFVRDSTYSQEGNGIYIAYRPPGASITSNGTNTAPQVISVILAFSRKLEKVHMVGGELGWIQDSRWLITDPNRNITDLIPTNTPQLRLSYKWMPLTGDHILEPYLGAGMMVGATFGRMPRDRFQGLNVDMQALAGLRINPEGSIFFQLEVPYTYFRAHQLLFPDGSTASNTAFGPDFFMGQFWPLIGVGVKW